MKPANFPERKNARRKAALAALPSCGDPHREQLIKVERSALLASIVPNARGVQTKKFGGRIARQSAWARKI